ncbi:MAG: hypothetical protein AAFW82_07150 [Pseudomonadota bacterium]
MEIISWILFILLIAGILTVGGVLIRDYLSGVSIGKRLTDGFFASKPPDKRLDVVEQTIIDGRRRLVLIRRDNVEHLIMTGGPVDVVIETNIGDKQTALSEVVRPAASQAAMLPSTNEGRPAKVAQQLE